MVPWARTLATAAMAIAVPMALRRMRNVKRPR